MTSNVPRSASAPDLPPTPTSGRALLPPRERLVIRAGHVLSCDPDVGDVTDGELLIEDGRIAAVGRNLHGGGARVIDVREAVAIPGLIDSHWHLWTSLMRSLVVDGDPELGYFPLKRRLGPAFTPADTYWSLRLGLAEGLRGGITTVHDWYHNVRGPADAAAAIQAHHDAGVRAHVSMGAAEGAPDDEPIDLELLGRLARGRTRPGRHRERISFGLALRGPQRCPPEVYRREWAAARALGLPVTMHAATSLREVQRLRAVQRVHSEGLLDDRSLVIHAIHTNPDEHAALAATGAVVSLSPASEMRIGMGVPPVAALLGAGVKLALSIDTIALTGTADLFAVMRLTLQIARAQGMTHAALEPRRLLELATIDAARAIGLGDRTGSLTPGKRADVALIRLDALNVAPVADLATAIVNSARPDDVELVIADGRLLVRDSALVDDEGPIVAEAARRLAALCARTGLKPPFTARASPTS